MNLVEMVAEKVRDMDYAAEHARGWTEPSTCGIGTDMPCRHDNCIERAAHYAAHWTQLSVRHAITLESLIESATSHQDSRCRRGRPRRTTPVAGRRTRQRSNGALWTSSGATVAGTLVSTTVGTT